MTSKGANRLETELREALGQATPRGAGFAERMAAGARQRARRQDDRRIVWTATAGLAAAGVAVALWFAHGADTRLGEAPNHVANGDEEAPMPMDGETVAGAEPGTGPALLVFEVEPEGEAFIAGVSVGSTDDPIETAPGMIDLEVKLAGEVKIRWRGELAPGQWKRFRYKAPSTPSRSLSMWSGQRSQELGSLQLATTPAGARVFLGERELGRSPLVAQIEPGTHRVKVTADDYETAFLEVRVEPLATRSMNLVLKKAPSRSDFEGSFDNDVPDWLRSDPVDPFAEAKRGSSPRNDIADPFADAEVEGSPASGLKNPFGDDVATEGPAGQVQIGARPWAKVTIDGRAVGVTPLTVSLSPGRHRVTLRRAGYKTRSVTVHVEPRGRTKIMSTLELAGQERSPEGLDNPFMD